MLARFWPVAALALICGLGLGLVQAPYHFYPAIFFWVLAYFLAAHSRRDLTVGYFFGLGYFALTMSWIIEPFAVGPPAYANLGPLAWALMAVGLALFWLPIFVFRRFGLWAIALGYLLVEGLRAVIFTGLPWGLMAHGFVDLPLAQSASILGTFLLSALLVLIALWLGAGRGLQPHIGAVVLLLMLMATGWFRAAPGVNDWADYSVAVVQANQQQGERFDPNLWRGQLDEHIALSAAKVDLVIWPEAASRFSPSDGDDLRQYILAGIGARAIIFGAPSFDDGRFFNSAYGFDQGGAQARYDKRHLVPFGEYIPFGDFLFRHGLFIQTVTTFSGRKGEYRPWTMTTGHPRPIILICYEGIFPWLSRGPGDYLVQITNDSWFGTRSGPYQHLDIARYRAIENGLPLVRSAITGISAVIGAQGEIRAQIPLGQAGVMTTQLGPRYVTTLYRWWGEGMAIMVVFIGLGVIATMTIRRRLAQTKQ